jgi:ParB/RepB/Spo0J family partition protein
MNETIQYIPISLIDRPRLSLRPVRRNSPEYVEMVNSVRKDGILQPVLVRPVGDRYEIVEGWHRLEAAKEAGLEELPALIKDLTDSEVMVFQLKCNSIRPKTASFEYARRLKLLMDEGRTMRELSALIDKSPDWIRNQLQLNRLKDEVRPPVERGEVSMRSAVALANLPRDLQDKFIDDAIRMKPKEFEARAKSALRDFKAYLLRLKEEDKKESAFAPKLQDMGSLRREAFDSANGKEVIKRVEAKTALEGWEACMSWVFMLDPISIERRHKNEVRREKTLNKDEYRKLNRNLIKKFVNPQSRLGDYRTS